MGLGNNHQSPLKSSSGRLMRNWIADETCWYHLNPVISLNIKRGRRHYVLSDLMQHIIGINAYEVFLKKRNFNIIKSLEIIIS